MAESYAIFAGAPLARDGAKEVGNKAWNLMRMAQAGLPVPPAFVLPTSWCKRRLPEDETALRDILTESIARLENATGLAFGAERRPLLVSVRSGAAISMPGMMETVLDVGLNAQSVEGLIRLTGNPRLGWDCYRRFVQGYAEVVADLPTAPFDALVTSALEKAGAASEREFDFRDLRTLTFSMLDCFHMLTGNPFPSDPGEQLFHAVLAVFRSWDSEKAASYRRINGIADDLGTAVTVQTMVYGNAGGASGSGVGFTRNPATGENELYFDFQFNAQGEDVVAGRQKLHDNERLPVMLPALWARLKTIAHELETLFGDVQDFEFTIQAGELFLLQTRRAKRTDWAALQIAVDLVEEGLIQPAQALDLLKDIDLNKVERTRFAPPVPDPLVIAQTAGVGVANGMIALDLEAVKRQKAEGNPAILVRHDTTTADIEGMALAAGILTASGGRTSHAAVVSRQLGKVCLVGCPGLEIDLKRRSCRIGQTVLNEGDWLSLNGNNGDVHVGQLKTMTERPEHALAKIAQWRRFATA